MSEAEKVVAWAKRKHALARSLLGALYENRLFRTWLRDRADGWELISGLWSPFYVQVRHVPSYPTLLAQVGAGFAELIRKETPKVNRLVGVASAGVPLAIATGLSIGLPVCYTRKAHGVRTIADLETATTAEDVYGEHAQVEGELSSGDHVALIDDVAAKFSSKEVALRQLTREAECRGLQDVIADAVIVLIDREQGAVEAAKSAGVGLHSIVRLRSDGLEMLKGIALPRELEVMAAYLDDPSSFQSPVVRAQLAREARSWQARAQSRKVNPE